MCDVIYGRPHRKFTNWVRYIYLLCIICILEVTSFLFPLEIIVTPLLIRKGEVTKMAMYGLSSVKDERLFRLFREGRVHMQRYEHVILTYSSNSTLVGQITWGHFSSTPFIPRPCSHAKVWACNSTVVGPFWTSSSFLDQWFLTFCLQPIQSKIQFSN